MSFFLRYVVYYLLGAAALIAASAYLAVDAGYGAATWVAVEVAQRTQRRRESGE